MWRIGWAPNNASRWDLTLILPMWRIWWAPNNDNTASRWDLTLILLTWRIWWANNGNNAGRWDLMTFTMTVFIFTFSVCNKKWALNPYFRSIIHLLYNLILISRQFHYRLTVSTGSVAQSVQGLSYGLDGTGSNQWNRVSPTDYADLMRRARWKAYHTARRREKVGNYLEIL